MIAQHTIQQILSRIDVIDVTGTFVKLKKRGANYLGLCPFHNERTPSFTVSPAKEIFKCFGCGKSGNSISFLMEHEKFTYVEALRWLANRYNIEIEETAATPEIIQQQQTTESLFIINQFAQQFYSEQLRSTEEGKNIAFSYLQKRGFTNETIQKFALGYAPDKRDAFTSKAIANQYNPALLQKAGLVFHRNDQFVDTYRDRIIFPVHNPGGKIIGFGARLIKNNENAPKYINTPENELYVKSKVLYGMYFARQAIDRANECLLVEGYTDVISLHQSGIENVVASGGTSLTNDQVRLIKKYTKNLTIIYDGDNAGIKAALRGLDMAIEEGLNVKLVLVPDKEDPDSYLQKVGSAAFREFIEQHKKDFVLFQLEIALKEAGTDAAKKAEVVNLVAATIAKIDRTEDFTKQQDYIRQSAQLLKIDETGFTSLVNKFIRERIVRTEQLPFDEAKTFEDNAKKGNSTDFDDQTFQLLFKDELQEREIARVLIEHGTKTWKENGTVAEYILSELPEEDLFQSQVVLKFIHTYREMLQKHQPVNKNTFIYHPDPALSTFTVSLVYNPYEESYRWKKDFSQSTGYQKELFQKEARDFYKIISPDNAENLQNYLKIGEDKTYDEVESAINYLKLRKINKMILQNNADMEGAPSNEYSQYIRTHQVLKQMEIDLIKKLGTVVIK